MRWLLPVLLLFAAGCTSVNVRTLPPKLRISHVCIQENPKVKVNDFIQVLRDGFDRNGYSTEVFQATAPARCQAIVTYNALQSWDFSPYLSQADVTLWQNYRKIASAEYHLVGKGGFSLMKWQGTKSKMDPVIDELLAQAKNPPPAVFQKPLPAPTSETAPPPTPAQPGQEPGITTW